MKNKNAVNHGFTLVELLIVVLIIGVLMSIALPMYQGAVDKSRWAKLLSPSRAIANAEEAILMSQGKYTTEKDDLSVSLPDDGEYTYTLYTTENGDDGNFVRLESNKLEDVRLARYYEKDDKYSNHLYCEAKNGNARAKKLCEKLLGGAELLTTDDGYKAYFLAGEVTEGVCGSVHGWWSNNFNKCFSAEQDRCTANGMPYDPSTGVCGWNYPSGPTRDDADGQTINEGGICTSQQGYCNNSTINAGGKCQTTRYGGCNDSIVNSGGVCEAASGEGGCHGATVEPGGKCVSAGGPNSTACNNVTIKAGAICDASNGNGCRNGDFYGTCIGGTYLACRGVYSGEINTFHDGSVCVANAPAACHTNKTIFKEGSICIANFSNTCNADYSQGGCCCGRYCPSGTRCAASACTSEYIQPY